jgi:CSLREA domain-containing protein
MTHAATFNVDSTADLPDSNPGDGLCTSSVGRCTLRAAIMEANANAVGSSLINVPAGTYRFSIPPQGANQSDTGDLNLAALPGTSILLSGAGPGGTIVDANRLDTVFRVEAGSEVMMSGMTIRGGADTSPAGSGGSGVISVGNLVALDVDIEGNNGDYGAGIYMFAASTSTGVTLIDSTVQHNIAAHKGGGIAAASGTFRIYNSTVNDNGAEDGGGIWNEDVSYVVNSTIANNTADENGGGISNDFNMVFVYNSTITGNDADHNQDDVGGFGGGVLNRDASGARLGLVNSLLSSNTYRFVPLDSNCAGTLELYGTNLTSSLDVTCATTNASFALLTPSLIGPLQDNGGATFTQALLPGSEAIDSSIDVLGCVDELGAPLASDQRGAHRPAGARCDVGAYEYGSIPPITDTIFANGFE